MAVQDEITTQPADTPSPLAKLDAMLSRLIYLDGEKLAYAVILVIAIVSRFWDLGARVMSHDEGLHTRFSWGLYRGEGFAHTPMMHGPVLFHITALNYLLFGASDFTSRIYAAVVGIIVVMLPYFMRRWLGKAGALAASLFFLISPLILYYSRYIREDMPAIFGALVMVVATWHYIETRDFKYLIVLAIGQFILFASKEVSFIYIAIFGSFLTLYLISRLLEAGWKSGTLRLVFAFALVGVLGTLVALGIALAGQEHGALPGADMAETVTPLDPNATPEGEGTAAPVPVNPLILGLEGATGFFLVMLIGSALIGQWRNLRRFPELDVAMVMGTLILPPLTPFLIHFAGFNPLDQTSEGIIRTGIFLAPVLLISVLIGLAYFMKPPAPHRIRVPATLTLDEIAELGDSYDPATRTVETKPDLLDWIIALFTSRWWAIGGPYWLLFLFFFTTMFTNGAGIGTGIIGSLAYWLEQQGVERGNQPWYYYVLVMVPMYEFLPLILTITAGFIGLGRWVQSIYRWLFRAVQPADEETAEEGNSEPVNLLEAKPASRRWLDLDAPVAFPVLLFLGYWAVTSFIAYSIAGEKMPWLTSHLTTPMILIGGWVTGQLLVGIKWRSLWESRAWVLLLLIPVVAVALMRVSAPLCSLTPAFVPCNTIIPASYQAGVFSGHTIAELSATGGWLAALMMLVGGLALMIRPVLRAGIGQLGRLIALWLIGWLAFVTIHVAWRAAYINYDRANEFIVYAHSSGAVKEALSRIEEISLRTTDGYGLRVAYDNQFSWPGTWYLRDYYNAVYYADQPSRGLIGDAPVIIAGPSNWTKVEPLIGDRYYQFEYIRMWWPMQDYFGYEEPDRLLQMLSDVLHDPLLQRGLWEIFYNVDYDTYADAAAAYRNGNRPDFTLSQWPIAERFRLYIRRDVFAQVWDYGVTASEVAQATDPYAAGFRTMTPDVTFGQGLLNRPHAIALGPDGLLYVADTNNHRIVVFDRGGVLQRTIGMYGLAPQAGVFNEPWGVTVGPDGTVYVADTWNHRISAFTPDGQFLFDWGTEGINQPDSTLAFWGPRAVTTDADGNVYVADTGNKRIMVYDRQGIFIRQIGSGGALEGQLDEPVGLAFGDDGLLYVADTWNQRIQVFTREGLFVRQWYVDAWFAQTNERPYLDVDAMGNVYVTDPEAARVIVFDSLGQYIYSFGDFTTIGQAGAVLSDDEGHLFVVDTQNGAVQRYTIGQVGGQQQ